MRLPKPVTQPLWCVCYMEHRSVACQEAMRKTETWLSRHRQRNLSIKQWRVSAQPLRRCCKNKSFWGSVTLSKVSVEQRVWLHQLYRPVNRTRPGLLQARRKIPVKTPHKNKHIPSYLSRYPQVLYSHNKFKAEP